MPIGTPSVIRLSDFPPTLPNMPPNYPLGPAPGKLQLLLNSNSNYLYHKFSPYTNYQDSVLASILSNRQPFIYTYIDQYQNGIFNKLPQTVQSLGSIVGITPETVDDVVRVSKFVISSWGVQFLVTQAAIQRLAPFDETRIYNPLSSVLSTVYPLTLGLGERPVRHIEGGLLGLANSVTSIVGINLQSGFQTPASTVGNAALPISNTGQGKGLIRGSDAAKGATSFQSKWSPAKSTNGSVFDSALNNFATSVKDSFFSFFGGAPKAKGIFRSDEEGYKIISLGFQNLYQPWFASATDQIDKIDTYGMPPMPNKSTFGVIGSAANANNTQTVFIKKKLVSLPDRFDYLNTTYGFSGLLMNDGTTINTRISDGFGNDVSVNTATGYDGTANKYGDVIGKASDNTLLNSEMLVQYSYYVQESNNYPSKFSTPSSERVKYLNDNLKLVLDKINKSSDPNNPGQNAIYKATYSPGSYLLPGGGETYPYNVEYNSWVNKQNNRDFKNPGVSEEYASWTTGVKSIDASVSSNNNLRMATSFMSDGINTLGILSDDRIIASYNSSVSKDYTGWKEWKPYDDDLIAFYFYDVVNSKYIPFRATVKAISEGNTAFWDELRFIGRADQLYSYNGFSRTLSFTFNVVISSVNELLPSWKKINYIASAVKPSNYTTGKNVSGQYFNRFIVPPMFMLTIGDLYKFQPIVITSLNVNIPDDASWETLNENNSQYQGWSYLNGLITAPNLGKRYGQLPREVEVAVTCNVLEKERAIVGGSHFGHEPRVDDWETLDEYSRFLTGSANIPYLPVPTELHQNFVEWNNPGEPDDY
jgi:hypothetical protein